MERKDVLQRVLGMIDEAANLIEGLGDDEVLRPHLQVLEGYSNGGWPYSDEAEEDFWFLRDHVRLELNKEIVKAGGRPDVS